ncbi:MAG TPA: decaprenyl-phosphate phosphoribosyltransferase [Ktedonobacterales bacterium]
METISREASSPQPPARTPRHVNHPAALIRALRPTQWTKNVLVVLALLFAHRLGDVAALMRVGIAFAAFSLASSAVYVVNDLADRERDLAHPTKRKRPIASGQVNTAGAIALLVVCLAGAGALTAWLDMLLSGQRDDPFGAWGGSGLLFTLSIGAYLGLNAAYSLRLKHIVLWDVFIIAAGFVLRALAGALAVPVPISSWFYLCITFGALFLALGKRRAEVVSLAGSAATHRKNLADYPLQLLDQLMVIVVTCTVISYSLYTFQGEWAGKALELTIPFVLFGIFRYLYLVYARGEGAHPDELLRRDPQLIGVLVCWLVAVVTLLYVVPGLRA